MSTVMFDNLGYSGNKEDYYSVDNSYLDKLMETRKGIPISLAALYVAVCRLAGRTPPVRNSTPAAEAAAVDSAGPFDSCDLEVRELIRRSVPNDVV